MSEIIKIHKGLDIKLKGKSEKNLKEGKKSKLVAIKPTDFHLVTPKLLIKPEDKVKAGTALFFDKYQPNVFFTSPMSGKVQEIVRGERRKILEVLISADDEIVYEKFPVNGVENSDRESIIKNILRSGIWPFIKQLPYNVIARPAEKPKAIFISGFDSSPLAPDYNFLFSDELNNFQTGVNVLSKLTEGKVHLSLRKDKSDPSVFEKTSLVELHYFHGPHPSGNEGVQIQHIDPVNKGEVVWKISPLGVIMIGRLFLKGIYDASRIVAVAGAEFCQPGYVKTICGAKISDITDNDYCSENIRIISGNVLTGTKVSKEGYLSFYDSLITIIPEGNYHEFLGWSLPGLKKFSNSRTFLSWLTPGKQYKLDTNLHGGVRAFIMNGEYEKVLPMNILPQHLLKAIIVNDIDKMEQLGIYEVAEEDFALCEFVCTSKIEVQSIIREGLDTMMKELS